MDHVSDGGGLDEQDAGEFHAVEVEGRHGGGRYWRSIGGAMPEGGTLTIQV
jgi:hypothetical protein